MAKRQKNSISVSWHDASKQFVKWVGKTKGDDGKLRPKCHYLGDDETVALNKAAALRDQWKTLRKSGADAWPEAAPPAEAKVSDEPKAPATVEEAAKQFLASVEARRDAGQVSGFHYESMRCKVSRVVSFLGPKEALVSIGESELTAFVLLVAKRPQVRDKYRGYRPMSIAYARKVVGTLKLMFSWFYETGRWDNRPRGFDRLFRFKPVLTVSERSARLTGVCTEPRYFKVTELADCYEVANGRHRLWLLLALNCGFCQAELDSLRRFEIKGLGTAKPYIERFRQKTSVYGRWSLWPETAELLQEYMADPNDDDIALFTERGRRLKSVVRSGVLSSVSQAWRLLVERSGIEPGSFKLLRKTGARMTKVIGGLEVSELYLAHQEPGQNKAYAGRRWELLDAALGEMRRQLAPMFAVKREQRRRRTKRISQTR
jgi:integrase